VSVMFGHCSLFEISVYISHARFFLIKYVCHEVILYLHYIYLYYYILYLIIDIFFTLLHLLN